MYSLLKKFVSSKEKHQENIDPIFYLIRSYSLRYYDDGGVIPESIDNFINNLYTLISISKSEEEDFIYIKTLFYTRGVKSEKQLTLEGYEAYISKNANKQDNLDKLINFIIDGIKNAKPIYVTDVHNKNYYIKVFLEDINSIKKPELKIATALKTVYDIKGGNNKQYKEILGKRRRIYKIKGSRKEHVKYKGELIPVSDYKKLFKK